MVTPINLLSGRGNVQLTSVDPDVGNSALRGARQLHSQPMGNHPVTEGQVSSRQGATVISGALERLSDLGRALSGVARQAPRSLARLTGMNSRQANLLPVTRQDIELSERNHAGGNEADTRQELLSPHEDNRYKKLEDKLNQEVLADTFNWGKAGKQAAKALARGAAAGTAIYGSYSLVNALIQTKVPEAQQATARGFAAMGVLAPVYNEGKELINGLHEAFSTEAKLSYAEALEKTHLRRQKETTALVRSMPRDIREACTKIDLSLQQAFAAARRGDTVKFALIRGMMHWRQDFLLGRPMRPREVDALKTDRGRGELIGKMSSLMRNYSDPLQAKLSGFATGIGARSLQHELPPEKTAPEGFDLHKLRIEDDWHLWKTLPSVPKQMMMLAGEPGTGKTHYVERVLPELLGLPVAGLVMPDKQAGGVNALMGKEWSALEQEEFVTADTDALGKIGLKLIRAGCTNPVLFLDEADLDDMDGIKRLTDPSKDELEAVALETILNFRQVTIMLGVNAMKKAQGAPESGLGELDTALADRLEMAVFEGTSRETKRERAVDAYHGWAGLYCLPVKDGDGPLLDDSQQQQLQTLFKGSLDYLVDFHHEKANIPGARMWVSVASVTNFISWHLLQEKHLGIPALTPDRVEQYIADLYAPRLPRQSEPTVGQGEAQPESSRAAEERASSSRYMSAASSFYHDEGTHSDPAI